MAEVWVQLPLGALVFGVWESLEIRVLREHENVGSNPTAPTERCGGACVGTGWRLLTVVTQVRFLPPQLKCETEVIRLDEEPVSKTGAVHTVVGSSPTASAQHVLLAERQRLRASNPVRRVRLPQSTLVFGSVAQRQSSCLLGNGARVRVPPVPLRIAG